MNPDSNGLLIVHREELTSSDGRRPLIQGTTAIYTKRDGTAVALGRSLFPMEKSVQQFKVRFDVSTADHEFHDVDVSTWLTSNSDALRFTGSISFGFRVTDPKEVVARNIVNGYDRVLSRLRVQLVDISRQYHISQYNEVQRHMNGTFGNGVALDGGISVYHFSAHIVRNSEALDAGLRAVIAVDEINVVQANNMLASAQQDAEAALERQKMDALQQAISGNYSPLHLVLARNPGQVLEIMNMMANSRQASAQQQLEVLKHLTDNNLIMDVDVAEIRDQIIRGVMDATREGSTGLHNMLTGPAMTPAGHAITSASAPPAPAQAPAAPAAPVQATVVEPEPSGAPRPASGVTAMKPRRTNGNAPDGDGS